VSHSQGIAPGCSVRIPDGKCAVGITALIDGQHAEWTKNCLYPFLTVSIVSFNKKEHRAKRTVYNDKNKKNK
jgi:hypothetical protein